MAETNKRLGWIDTARGLAMLAIYHFHTEVYYTGEIVTDYDMYVENALSCFFFISGYLFYREGAQFDLRRKLKSILKSIVIPYFIFTAAIAFPKDFVHGYGVPPMEILLSILKGQASWFVTALAVAETVFALMMALPQKYSRVILPSVCAATYVMAYNIDIGFNPVWNINSAMVSMIFLYAGYMFHTVEKHIGNRVKWLLLLLPPFAALKWYEHVNDITLIFNVPEMVTSPAIFLADNLMSCLLITTAARYLDVSRFIRFVGANSLIWYFLAGGVPLLTTMALTRLGMPYDGNHLLVFFAMAIECCITSAATIIIMKYAPFVVGKKRKTSEKQTI